MKNFYFLLLIFIGGCTPPVVFEQPYPTDKPNLAGIPQEYQGAFICESDSSLVIIAERDITVHKSHYFRTQLSRVDQRDDCRIENDKMYIAGREECIPLSIVSDSVVQGVFHEVDTLFVMSSKSVARYYEGHLVISQELQTVEWAVSLLSRQLGGDVTYRAITDKTSIKEVKRITQATDITRSTDKKPRYRVKPTMREFEDLLKSQKVFVECEYLQKVVLEEQLKG